MPKLKLASDVGPRMSRHRDGHLPFATKRAANELLARCRRRALLDHALRAGSERVPSTRMDSCVVSIRSRCVLVGGCMVEQLPWCCSQECSRRVCCCWRRGIDIFRLQQRWSAACVYGVNELSASSCGAGRASNLSRPWPEPSRLHRTAQPGCAGRAVDPRCVTLHGSSC